MPRKKQADADQHDMLNIQERLETAPCVPAIRQAVREWRERHYMGATDVTRDLLNFWFQTEHRLPLTGLFRYHNAQREAIETLIYLYEVAQARRRADLLNTYALFDPKLRFAGFAQNIKLPSQFAALCPKLREFFERKAFGQAVNLYDPQVIQAMNADLTGKIATAIFESSLRANIVEPKTPQIIAEPRRLSSLLPFATSKKVFAAHKTVFNYTVCDNEYELAFAKFLDAAPDVSALAKLPMEFDFAISYTDTATNIRHYFPDFLVKRDDGSQWIIETKGLEDVNVARKDEAAQDWCAAAAELTGAAWKYLKVPQTDFESFRPETFAELLMGANFFST